MIDTNITALTLLFVGMLAPVIRAEEVVAPVMKSIAIRPFEDRLVEYPDAGDDAGTTGVAPSESLEQVDESQVEVIRTRYPSRKVKIERHVAQNKEREYFNHGSWTMWSPDGEIIGTGQYRWGKRQGSWTRLITDDNAQRQIEESQLGFEAPLVSKAEFIDDEIHGTWLVVDANNRKVRSWHFDGGTLHGQSVAWYPSGARLREVNYDNGVPNGEVREWSADGQLVKQLIFKNGQRLAPFVKRYDFGGVQMEGKYLLAREMINIRVDWWASDVNIEVTGKEGNDVKHGNWTHFYQDGGKAYEGQFVDGLPLGDHIWWYPNGQKKTQGSFANGKPNGHWVWWHESGVKQMDGHYVDGVQDKTWVRWEADGKVAQVEDHSLRNTRVLNQDVPEEVEVIDRDDADRTATRTLQPVLPLKPVMRLRR